MEPRILSLFTGYGGLDMAIEAITGGHVVAVSDIAPGPCKLLAHYHPDVPNLGDVKAIEWTSADVPEFDVLTGGYPCQPFSVAGRRGGQDDPRHLWPDVYKAIVARRPRHVYLENVRGHLSLGFDTVLTDLANADYAVTWTILAASSVGAAHRRERLYIYATPGSGADMSAVTLPSKLPLAGILDADGLTVLDRVDESVRRSSTANDLLPTPTARDHKGGTARRGGKSLGDLPILLPIPDTNAEWGKYADAIARWTLVVGTPPPAPVEPNKHGKPRLTAAFTEWMMGVEPGHITGDDLGLSRTEAIKLAGNGVVPQAAVMAFSYLVSLV